MSRRATRDISRSNARNIRANDSPEKENIGRNLPLDGIFAQIRHQSDERKDPLPCPERPRKDLHGLYAPDARFPLARGRMPLRALSESTDATRNRRIQFDRGRDQTARERALLVLGARTIARLLESGVLTDMQAQKLEACNARLNGIELVRRAKKKSGRIKRLQEEYNQAKARGEAKGLSERDSFVGKKPESAPSRKVRSAQCLANRQPPPFLSSTLSI